MKNICPSCGMVTHTTGKLCFECEVEVAGAVAEVARRILRDAEARRLETILEVMHERKTALAAEAASKPLATGGDAPQISRSIRLGCSDL